MGLPSWVSPCLSPLCAVPYDSHPSNVGDVGAGRGRWMWALAVSVAGIGAGVGVGVGGEVNGGVVEGEGPEVASDVDGEKERELSTLTPSYR